MKKISLVTQIKPAFVLCKEAEAKGLSVSLTNIVDRTRTDLNNALSSYFKSQCPSFKAYYGEDEFEEVIESLNEWISEEKLTIPKLSMGGRNLSEVVLMPITPNLSLKVYLYDEYYGEGEYSTGVHIERFLITEEATNSDVDILVEKLNDYGIQ